MSNGRLGNRTRQLPIVGKITTGAAPFEDGINESKFPISLDYFRIVTELESVKKAFYKTFGDKPDKILISFATDDVMQNCNEYYVCLNPNDKGREIWRGTEKLIQYKATNGNGTMPVVIKDEATFKKYLEMGDVKRRVEMRFALMLPTVPIMGLFEWKTSAEFSADTLIDSYDLVESQANVYGKSIIGVPFWLTVEKKKSNLAGSTKVYNRYKLIADFEQKRSPSVALIADTSKSVAQLQAPEQKVLAAAHAEPEIVEPDDNWDADLPKRIWLVLDASDVEIGFGDGCEWYVKGKSFTKNFDDTKAGYEAKGGRVIKS